MSFINRSYRMLLISHIFIFTVIIIQIIPWYMGILLLIAFFIVQSSKYGTNTNIYSICLLYIIGFLISEIIRTNILDMNLPIEWKVILSRFSLIGFILPFYIKSKYDKTDIRFLSIGSFTNTIYFPFIWSGIVKDPIWRFLIISSTIIIFSCSFIIDFEQPGLLSMFIYAILFSTVNSILEEILWRGYILHSFVSRWGEKCGLLITSVGFGFYHYSLGIPWSMCALFSLFGMLMGGLAIRSNGLLAVIILHFLMNIIFVLIGMIF